MQSVTLCEFRSDDIDIQVWAELKDGALSVNGQDQGPKVEEFWGENEHEYFYTLSTEDTSKLYVELSNENASSVELLELIKYCFSGVDGCRKFRDFCEEHHIPVKYFSC